MNNTMKSLAAGVLALTACQAMAVEDNVDIKVTGKIVPPACKPQVSGGALFDYGTIKAGSLSKDNYTTLDEKKLDFSLVCEAPMVIALSVSDMRADSAVEMPATPNFSFNRNANANFINGLGKTVDGKNIGNYQAILITKKAIIDGSATPVVTLDSSDGGATWAYSEIVSNLSGRFANGTLLQTWASPGTTIPVKFKIFSLPIAVQANINKASEFDLTKVINLDGLMSIQINYL